MVRESKCAFLGCNRPAHATGLCSGHYRQRARGLPLRPLRPIHRVVNGEKECSLCHLTKPVGDFYDRGDGQPMPECKDCTKERTARDYARRVKGGTR